MMKKLAVQKGPVKANVKTSKMLPEAVKAKVSELDSIINQ